MDKEIISFFEKHQLTLKDKSILVAVSTGVDSMALLYGFLLLKEEYHLNIYVAHFNHQKREQSIEEEKYIIDFSKQHNIECFVEKLESKEYDNFQSYAREERYKFFQKIMEETNSDYLALAHHAEDNIETILMRIIRGSNLKGYSGMDEVLPFHNKTLIRPFIGVIKEDIIKFVHQHKIKYYQDISNFMDTYTRNRIRKEIIPSLYKEDKKIHEKFMEFANTLKETNLLLEEKVDQFISLYSIKNDDLISFKKEEFSKLSTFIQIEVLFKILKEYRLSKANIEEIIKLINSNKKNIKLIFKSKFTFVKEYDMISIYYKALDKLDVDITIHGVGEYKINDKISIIVSNYHDAIISNLNNLCYNINMLPIRIRSRKDGDKILLDSGYKKVKDLLIDQKIGIVKRDNILIAEKDDEILAVLGIKKSQILKQILKNDIIIKVENKNG